MKRITADMVAEEFLKCFIRHHGLPRAIVSDRGSQFVGHMWSRIYELLQINHHLSTSYHPKTDGVTKRINQEIKHYLRYFATYS